MLSAAATGSTTSCSAGWPSTSRSSRSARISLTHVAPVRISSIASLPGATRNGSGDGENDGSNHS